MEERVKIEILKNGGYWALSINDTRYGPDAGPWKVIGTFNIKKSELIKMIEEDNQRG